MTAGATTDRAETTSDEILAGYGWSRLVEPQVERLVSGTGAG
jgi:hypothetical protein